MIFQFYSIKRSETKIIEIRKFRCYDSSIAKMALPALSYQSIALAFTITVVNLGNKLLSFVLMFSLSSAFDSDSSYCKNSRTIFDLRSKDQINSEISSNFFQTNQKWYFKLKHLTSYVIKCKNISEGIIAKFLFERWKFYHRKETLGINPWKALISFYCCQGKFDCLKNWESTWRINRHRDLDNQFCYQSFRVLLSSHSFQQCCSCYCCLPLLLRIQKQVN